MLLFIAFGISENLGGPLEIEGLFTLLFYQIEPYKKGPFLVLLSSIGRNSSVPNAKRIFEILWGIHEGRINSARPSRPCLKNCQNGTFWSVHGIWNFLGQMTSFEVLLKCHALTLSQKFLRLHPAPFKCLSHIWEDKLDYLNNPSQDFKNSFCLWSLWIFHNAGRQNWRGPIFLRFDLIE